MWNQAVDEAEKIMGRCGRMSLRLHPRAYLSLSMVEAGIQGIGPRIMAPRISQLGNCLNKADCIWGVM